MAELPVHEPRGMRWCQHYPGRGEVAVEQAHPVRRMDGSGERLDDLGRRQKGKRLATEEF